MLRRRKGHLSGACPWACVCEDERNTKAICEPCVDDMCTCVAPDAGPHLPLVTAKPSRCWPPRPKPARCGSLTRSSKVDGCPVCHQGRPKCALLSTWTAGRRDFYIRREALVNEAGCEGLSGTSHVYIEYYLPTEGEVGWDGAVGSAAQAEDDRRRVGHTEPLAAQPPR